jgi:hypothetical protein
VPARGPAGSRDRRADASARTTIEAQAHLRDEHAVLLLERLAVRRRPLRDRAHGLLT